MLYTIDFPILLFLSASLQFCFIQTCPCNTRVFQWIGFF